MTGPCHFPTAWDMVLLEVSRYGASPMPTALTPFSMTVVVKRRRMKDASVIPDG
jgi:hypothetical protein